MSNELLLSIIEQVKKAIEEDPDTTFGYSLDPGTLVVHLRSQTSNPFGPYHNPMPVYPPGVRGFPGQQPMGPGQPYDMGMSPSSHGGFSAENRGAYSRAAKVNAGFKFGPENRPSPTVGPSPEDRVYSNDQWSMINIDRTIAGSVADNMVGYVADRMQKKVTDIDSSEGCFYLSAVADECRKKWPHIEDRLINEIVATEAVSAIGTAYNCSAPMELYLATEEGAIDFLAKVYRDPWAKLFEDAGEYLRPLDMKYDKAEWNHLQNTMLLTGHTKLWAMHHCARALTRTWLNSEILKISDLTASMKETFESLQEQNIINHVLVTVFIRELKEANKKGLLSKTLTTDVAEFVETVYKDATTLLKTKEN